MLDDFEANTNILDIYPFIKCNNTCFTILGTFGILGNFLTFLVIKRQVRLSINSRMYFSKKDDRKHKMFMP